MPRPRSVVLSPAAVVRGPWSVDRVAGAVVDCAGVMARARGPWSWLVDSWRVARGAWRVVRVAGAVEGGGVPTPIRRGAWRVSLCSGQMARGWSRGGFSPISYKYLPVKSELVSVY